MKVYTNSEGKRVRKAQATHLKQTDGTLAAIDHRHGDSFSLQSGVRVPLSGNPDRRYH